MRHCRCVFWELKGEWFREFGEDENSDSGSDSENDEEDLGAVLEQLTRDNEALQVRV